MRSVTIGILAHVDAGKTSLTERLLYRAGAIDEMGSVDAGSTQTDNLSLERQRGMTIKSAVVSFEIEGVSVNLVDTPGHPDFIAEVERVLSVLDGVILVISAVEGVQAQTRVLIRSLQRLKIPTLIFVNKIDRSGARYEGVLHEISHKLTSDILPMGSTRDLGTKAAGFDPYTLHDDGFATRLLDCVAAHDEDVLASYVNDDMAPPPKRLRDLLQAQTKMGHVNPVFFGSAITGAGVEELIDAIPSFLPVSEGTVDRHMAGTVFKVERGQAGEKVALVRMFSGMLRTRDRIDVACKKPQKVTAISVFHRGVTTRGDTLAAGQIGRVWGLADVEIGDAIGAANSTTAVHHFAPPSLESAVVPVAATDKAALHAALRQIAEQDPLVNLRQDDLRGEMYISLYGEVQKEVIQSTLVNEFQIQASFRESRTICVERPVGIGNALETLGKNGNPFVATVGLRVEPGPPATGIEFRLEVEVGSIPMYVFKSVPEFRESLEETVRETLEQGLYGWQVVDATVTLTHCGYAAPSTGARDFRLLLPMVLMEALQRAGTTVCEPVHCYCIEIAVDCLATVTSGLMKLGATPDTPTIRDLIAIVEGVIPAARVHELQQRLPAWTHGEGVLESHFDHYSPVSGNPPTRPRSDRNPLNRKEYLLHVLRRV